MNFKSLIYATRPKTLPASIIPVLIGSFASLDSPKFSISITFLVLFCAVLIQIFTNFVNEIFDFLKGADNEKRQGPKRSISTGDITVMQMTVASAIVGVVAFTAGLKLVMYSDWVILALGIISLLFAFLYTGGPFPLAYNALGDLFVFIFFGPAAVLGTYYIFSGIPGAGIVLASLAPGFLSANILAVNNIRDIPTDSEVNKRTFAIILGRSTAIRLYNFTSLLSYLSVIASGFISLNYWLCLPLISIPLAVKLSKELKNKYGKDLNSVLEKTGLLLMMFGLLLCLGFLFGK